jgi:hypothetical protein
MLQTQSGHFPSALDAVQGLYAQARIDPLTANLILVLINANPTEVREAPQCTDPRCRLVAVNDLQND